jgi:hypothetical protein
VHTIRTWGLSLSLVSYSIVSCVHFLYFFKCLFYCIVAKLPGRTGAMTMIRQLQGSKKAKFQTDLSDSALNSSTASSNSLILEPNPPLTTESPVVEFREFHEDMAHPAMVLNLIADEDDREVYTEFDDICNEILTTLGEFESALEDMTIWKDDFLTQSVPSTVKLQLTLLFSKLFRR